MGCGLRLAISRVRHDRPFSITAIVLLPDHLHATWELARGDHAYSTRWRLITNRFTTAWLATGGANSPVSGSRRERREQGVWQRKVFEHTCRDDEDSKRSLDYLHVNPVRHKLVERVSDRPLNHQVDSLAGKCLGLVVMPGRIRIRWRL